MTLPSYYYDSRKISDDVSNGKHRATIGGLWEELGALQLDFLKSSGLTPQSRLLDIGCGSLRLGVRAIEYLNAGHYWGTDINQSLMDAGYEKEVAPAGLAGKLPRENLVWDGDFTFKGVPRELDFAIAQSVFTHLPLNHLRLCLSNLAAHLKGDCVFFVTMFIVTRVDWPKPTQHQPGGIVTHPHRDPYHYVEADLRHVAAELPWSVEFLGDWRHPRNQKMVIFTKTG